MWHQAPGPLPAHETGPAWGFRAHLLPVYLLSHFLHGLPPACLSVCSTGPWLSPPTPPLLERPGPPSPTRNPLSCFLVSCLWRTLHIGREYPFQTLFLERGVQSQGRHCR